jgi:aryl-alcohol dehydrogenase-like predicted oxidoreductase
MEYREFGNTGIKVSALGFGCGDVGGLIVRGTVQERLESVQRALDLGITYFDTASRYGNGQSEINLGAALRELKADPIVGTKVRLDPKHIKDIKSSVIKSVENSLARLGRDHIHLIQLHNSVTSERLENHSGMTPEDIHEVQNAFMTLRTQGKISIWGITAVGDTNTLHAIINSGNFNTVQTPYNLLNPSQGEAIPLGYPYQDFNNLIGAASSKRMGVIAIRVLAGGALSMNSDRHILASQPPAPIGSGADYFEDLTASEIFNFLSKEGFTKSIVEAAIRFVISNKNISTALVGFSSIQQLEYAVSAVEKGYLPPEVIQRLQSVRASLVNKVI